MAVGWEEPAHNLFPQPNTPLAFADKEHDHFGDPLHHPGHRSPSGAVDTQRTH
jgi:hypothetical protein